MNKSIRHVFLDEAQDYSPFQITLLKEFFPNSKMTVLGDFNQAIYPYTEDLTALLSEELYDMGPTERIVLTRSYRSTYEITDFTRSLVGGTDDIIPFNRHGEKPKITIVDGQHHHQEVIRDIKALQEKGHETIALICKTAKESQMAYDAIKHGLKAALMDKKTSTFEKGVLVLPAYLAKGIEFDAVIIYDASEDCYHRPEDTKLFYTACTRAMHELHLFSKGEVTPYIENVSPSAYTLKS